MGDQVIVVQRETGSGGDVSETLGAPSGSDSHSTPPPDIDLDIDYHGNLNL